MDLGVLLIAGLVAGFTVLAFVVGRRLGGFAASIVVFVLFVTLLDIAIHHERFQKLGWFDHTHDFLLGLAGGGAVALLLLLAWRFAPPRDG
jgi:hypothetical protein